MLAAPDAQMSINTAQNEPVFNDQVIQAAIKLLLDSLKPHELQALQ